MDIARLLELFGLNGSFTKSDLDQAYKDLVQVWHPDKYAYNSRLQHKAEEKLKEINATYTLLQARLSKPNTRVEQEETSQTSSHSRSSRCRHRNTGPQENTVNDARQVEASGPSGISLRSLFHPTDYSEAREIAFSHALKLGLMAKAKLSILHVAPTKDEADFSDFPEVRRTLERWGILPDGSSREDVFEKTGLLVEKIIAVDDDPVSPILHFLAQHGTDLVVLATHQFKEPARWLKTPIAEPIARESGGMTLFVPEGIEGFVSDRDGTVRLKRILIPIDHHPSPQFAIDAAAALTRVLGGTDCLFKLVHVGAPHNRPVVNIPTHAGWEWEHVVRHGEVVKEILALEREYAVDLLVMTTQGHDGFLDALRGSTTERVLRRAQCPLLAIPARRKEGAGA